MATTTTTRRQTLPTTKLVCFSFAAYAKNLIDHLKSLNIPVLPGLTDLEFASIESTFHFSFPPDLRSILEEGIPIGPHFPNWRNSSLQQLQILLSLPFLNLSRNISQNNFWFDSWGDKPHDNKKAMEMAKGFLGKAPVLVPIYWNCYIPSTPNVAGNPVFYVDDGHVRVLSFDVTRFFQEVEFLQMGFDVSRPSSLSRRKNVSFNVPAWAATAARRIEFWTEVAERGRRVVVRGPTRGWWSGDNLDQCQLRDCLEEVFWRLRDGGWKEEEVRDMMMMDGCDCKMAKGCCAAEFDDEDLECLVSVMSLVLLRAGWSREDIMYSLNLQDHGDGGGNGTTTTHLDGVSFLDLKVQLPKSCCGKNGDKEIITISPLATLFSIKDEDFKFKSRNNWDGRKTFTNRLRPPKTQKKKKPIANN